MLQMEISDFDKKLYDLIISQLSEKDKYLIIIESLDNSYRFSEAKGLLKDLIKNIKDTTDG
jgi:hypothetical protein